MFETYYVRYLFETYYVRYDRATAAARSAVERGCKGGGAGTKLNDDMRSTLSILAIAAANESTEGSRGSFWNSFLASLQSESCTKETRPESADGVLIVGIASEEEKWPE